MSHLVSIVLVLILVAVVFFAARYVSQPHSTTSTYTTIPTTTTAYINISNIRPNAPKLLAGIPNASQYVEFMNNTNLNFVLGAYNITAKEADFATYGLNFTNELITSPIEFAPNYTLAIPSKYADYKYPIISSIFAYNLSSPTQAAEFYNYELNYVLFGSNMTFPIYNKTVYYASNFSTATNSGVPGYTYATKTSVYNLNSSIPGMTITVAIIKPMYQTTEWFHVLVLYKNYFIVFGYFGVLNEFNQSSAINISERYINATLV